MIKISVIIPIYNSQEFLNRSIDSVLNQTYKNLEIILVNDGSKDKSGDICDKYALEDKRIIVIHKENEGVSKARNAALRVASGDYITFVDSDDYIQTTTYENIVKMLEQVDYDIIQFGHYVVDEKERVLKRIEHESEELVGSDNILKAHIAQNKINTALWNKLFKIELFKNLKFEDYRFQEDAMIIPNLCLRSKRAKVVRDSYYYYVQTNESIMRGTFTLKKLEDSMYSAKYIRDFLSTNYPSLVQYSYFRSVFYSVLNYGLLTNSNIPNKGFLKNEMIQEFKIYYPLLYRSDAYKYVSTKHKFAFMIFDVNKQIFDYLFRLFKG